MYEIKIKCGSLPTLEWLAGRGYDGGIMQAMDLQTDHDMCEVGATCTTMLTYVISEPDAWAIHDTIEEDTDAFLTCCGDDDLGTALIVFWQSIV